MPGRHAFANLAPIRSRCAAVALLAVAALPLAAEIPAPQLEFFEKKVRPVLAEKCYACHGSASKMAMGGLRVDSREALLKGGDSGPAIAPGSPERSLLVTAVAYTRLDLKMPPTGKLAEEEIAALTEWIRMGAPDPREDGTAAPAARPASGVDWEQARDFWSFRPIRAVEPPQVREQDWPANPIDRFILARLEAEGLEPAPPAARRDWIRRVSFSLTGLPPAPQDVQAFLADTEPGARGRVVERLLASPAYGERWARHWLDLVRFAETNGHEFDNSKLDAWRYRDYVIRAFHQDVPYDQFVREHIAGDLLGAKRASPRSGHWESPVGTSFYWFGEVLNSATDSIKSRADEVDNQIDVLGKAFLGLTVACARCHDHKFDPIPTADYYAIAGVLHSTDLAEVVIDSPERVSSIAEAHREIGALNRQVSAALEPARARQVGSLPAYLEAAALVYRTASGKDPVSPAAAATRASLEPALVQAWAGELEAARNEPAHLFHPLAALIDRNPAPGPAFAAAVRALRTELGSLAADAASISEKARQRGDIVFEDFGKLSYEGWTAAGEAFGSGPQWSLPPDLALRGYRGTGLASSYGQGSPRLVGSLTSPKFVLPKLYFHVRMAGPPGDRRLQERNPVRLTVVADGHKSQNILPDKADQLGWKTVRMTKEIGRLCYVEIVDRDRQGYLAVDKIVFSDSPEPPAALQAPHRGLLEMLGRDGLDSPQALLAAYRDLFAALETGEAPDASARWLLAALNPSGRAEDAAALLPAGDRQALEALAAQRAAMAERIPESAFAMVARDRDPRDIALHIRGNHKNLGEPVPRGFLKLIAGPHQAPVASGSGRLEMADWLASPANPLLARVLVNRVWKQHFGQGLVRSVDNFGHTGDRPTHPELLDWLAAEFIRGGWSIKHLQRLILLSSTYGMAAEEDPPARAKDPQNKLLSHMPVRRLEAEAIRDAMLALSGGLNPELFGPSVRPHISRYQDGRGKPESGPLDGDGRRSIYVEVRRNFLTPMLLAFDYPLPTSTFGRRGVSTVPSQALLMMNNEFVRQQAGRWAERIASQAARPEDRVGLLYSQAFSRPPEDAERAEALRFVAAQRDRHRAAGSAESENAAWADLAHVLLNSAEFLYTR